MKNGQRLPLDLPPKQMAIVMAFVVVYDLLMVFLGYNHYALIGTMGLFVFGASVVRFHQRKATLKHNWENLKRLLKGDDDPS